MRRSLVHIVKWRSVIFAGYLLTITITITKTKMKTSKITVTNITRGFCSQSPLLDIHTNTELLSLYLYMWEPALDCLVFSAALATLTTTTTCLMMSNLRVLIVVHDAIYNAPDRSDPTTAVRSADRTLAISRRIRFITGITVLPIARQNNPSVGCSQQRRLWKYRGDLCRVVQTTTVQVANVHRL